MPEIFKLEVGSQGRYETKKEWNTLVTLSDRQYLVLVGVIMDFLDKEKIQAEVPKLKE